MTVFGLGGSDPDHAIATFSQISKTALAPKTFLQSDDHKEHVTVIEFYILS